VTIRRLTRVRIGIVGLGELKPGEFRTLSDFEVRQLLGMCKGRSE
jgi:16S rRNA U516 pseudouridylate synthase RsuA-like enzyme